MLAYVYFYTFMHLPCTERDLHLTRITKKNRLSIALLFFFLITTYWEIFFAVLNKCSKIAKVSYNIFRSICSRRRQKVRVKAYRYRHMAESRRGSLIWWSNLYLTTLYTSLYIYTCIFIRFVIYNTGDRHCSRRELRSTFSCRKLLRFFFSSFTLSFQYNAKLFNSSHYIFDDCILFFHEDGGGGCDFERCNNCIVIYMQFSTKRYLF